MKARYDDIEITLEPRYKEALIELGESFIEMMRNQDSEYSDCWTWCEITITDLAISNGVSFYCGGEEDRPEGMAGVVRLIAQPQNTEER